MPRVLIYYRNAKPLVAAFESLGYEVVVPATLHGNVDTSNIALCLIDMYDAIKKPISSLLFKKKMNDASVPVIAWNRDGPSNKGEKKWRIELLRHLPYFDIYATHTMQVGNEFKKPQVYYANAASTSCYNLGGVSLTELRNSGRYEFDVSFFGRFDSKKYPQLIERERFLFELRKRMERVGLRIFMTDKLLSCEEQRNLIQTSRINLQIGASADTNYYKMPKYREPSWGLPERCYGIPACGGFLLSDHRKHGVDDFACDWQEFVDVDDCFSRIVDLLSDWISLRDVAESQHYRVIREHTYTHRAMALLAVAESWKMGANH